MKTNTYYWKSLSVFLFFIFTSVTFAQSNNCAATPTLTVGTTCTTTNYNVANTFTDSGVTESCTGTSWRDGWYTFTTDATTTLITINGTSDKRLGLALYTGACGSLSEVICTIPGTANANISNQIVLPNTTYRLRLMRTNNNNNNDMTGTVCVFDTSPAVCSGTPTAGTISVSPTSGAAGSSYTVSTTGYATGSGITYQWQYSTNGGGAWTNQGVATTTYSNYTATAPASGTVIWRLVVTCTNSSQSATSTTATFTTTTAYCTPTNTYSTSYYITNVTSTGGVSNFNNSSAGFAAYSNFSAQFVSQYAGAVFSLTATHPSSTYGYNVWVDWNNDADFNDAGENVISTGYLSTPASLGTVTIPIGQAAGNYRMRIRNAYLSNPAPACGSFDYGEAEDYTVRVIAPATCSGAPTAGITNVSPVSGSPSSTYVVSASGFTNATGLTFQWQYSTNGGGTWTNQGGATGTYSNYTATAPVTIGTTVLWHLIVTCTASGNSATSSNASFTTVNNQNIPTTGSNTITCGTNLVLYDNGGVAGDYANSSNGYTVLDAGIGATINISGNYTTESSFDYIRIYSGNGTGGTLLNSYSGTGAINYTGTVGQTLTIQFTSDGSGVYSGFALSIAYSGTCYPACSGTPTGGTAVATPTSSSAGSSYVVSATGYTGATGLTFQWQYSTNSGATWTNQGLATGTYSNVTATAPVLGTTVLWHLIVTCTASSQSATSTNGTFTSVATQNIPATGNNSVSCGTNIVLYDNGGAASDYANSSDGYTVLQAGTAGVITISGNYVTESIDQIRIYNGTGIGGAVLATYSGSSGGTINFTGAPGQTLTIRFNSDSSVTYSGFALSITYSGTCVLMPCIGAPTGGIVTTTPNTAWPGSAYVVSATGYTAATGLTFQWQYSTNGGGSWTNAGAATPSYANYNATAPASGVVVWHLIVTCSASGQSATSSNGTFTTMVVSDVATGCPNVVSGGLGLNGADPAPITCLSPSGCVDLEATYLNLGNTTSYIAEPIVYNPPFAFTGLANPISVNTDDVWSPKITLPFNFCFYGNTYTNCLVGSNGVITFDTTNNTPGSTCNWSIYGSNDANLPVSGHAALVENSIFGGFQDLHPTNAGNVGYQLVTLATGCRALVVAWSEVPLYYNDNANKFTGMTVLYENSNIIEVYIQKKTITTYPGYGVEGMWNDGNAVIGIQNATGTLASVPPGRNVLDPNWTSTNEAWRFVPNGTSIASIKWYEGAGTTGPVKGTTDVITVCPTSTTTYTAEITYTLCDGRTIKEVDQTTVTVSKDKTWNGATSTDWNVASNWTPAGVPLVSESVTIPNVTNKPIIGAGATAVACSLSVESGAVLTLSTGKNMVVTNAITVATGGTFNVKNAANLVQINNASVNSGTITMERITNVRLQDYSYWSSPVGALGAGTFPVRNISPLTPAGFVFKWETTAVNANGGQGNWVTTTENMIPAKGYILRAPNGFSNATPSALTATFTGTPNNGVFSPTIYRGTDFTTLGTQGIPRAATDDNWNLIGNPYPSALGVNEFLTLPANNTIAGGLRVWTHGQLPTNAVDPFYQNFVSNYYPSDYTVINLTGATSGPGDPTIGAGQGFMVLMNAGGAGSGTVTFNNSMRGVGLNNSIFYRSSEATAVNTIEQNRIWLDLVAPTGAVNRILVGYVTDATQAEDRLYDSFTDYKPSQNFYSLIGNEPMAIQGRALPFDENDFIPLGVTIPQAGVYKIAISALDGFFTTTNQTIYVEDLDNNIIHDLRQNPYSFSAVAGNITNRFILRYTNETLGNDDFATDAANLWVISSDALAVTSTKNEIQSVRVFDILGRELANYPKVNSYEVPLTKIQKNNAALIIQVTLSNGTVISKKAIY